MQIALVMAHPDDAEIAAGGLIGAWRSLGALITIVIATDGSRGGRGDAKALAARRADEARTAASLLGADLMLCGYPDGALAGSKSLVSELGGRLAALAPDLVVTHPTQDYHADHRALAVAVGQAASFRVPVVAIDPIMGVGFTPTHYIDITPWQDLKERAILCHSSQDPARFVRQARLQAEFRAAQCGHAGFAEAVRHDPVYPFADIRALLPPAPTLRAVRDRAQADPTPPNSEGRA